MVEIPASDSGCSINKGSFDSFGCSLTTLRMTVLWDGGTGVLARHEFASIFSTGETPVFPLTSRDIQIRRVGLIGDCGERHEIERSRDRQGLPSLRANLLGCHQFWGA